MTEVKGRHVSLCVFLICPLISWVITTETMKLFPSVGVYVCSKCNHPLFSSRSKFAHSSPWPAFTDTIREDSVTKMMETLTAYKVPTVCALWLKSDKCRREEWEEIQQRLSSQCCTFPGPVWKVWQRTGARVCQRWSGGRNITVLNIQPLAQVCPQQRYHKRHHFPFFP